MPPLSEEQIQQIRELLARHEKITAIKQYIDWTGDSLVKAKRAVESIQAGQPVIDNASQQEIEPDLGDVFEAIAAGKKLQAIKLYRNRTGTSLAEAKEFIEQQIESGANRPDSAVTPHGKRPGNVVQSQRSGCLSAGGGLLILVAFLYFVIDL